MLAANLGDPPGLWMKTFFLKFASQTILPDNWSGICFCFTALVSDERIVLEKETSLMK